MSRVTILVSLALAAAAPLLAGCFEQEVTVTLSYDRPAQVVIPDKVKRIAIARFAGANVQDQRWADITADKLSSELGKWSREYHRYELVDRGHLAQVLKEQDLQIMTSDQAVSAGKIAQVQAIIFGDVRVQTRDEPAQRQQYNIVTRRMDTVYYRKRFCLVSVSLTMTDVDNSKQIHKFAIPKQFDSDKEGGNAAIMKMFGMGSDNPPPVDDTVNKLVDEVVKEFTAQVSPTRAQVPVKLEPGASETVATGNKMAKAGDYAGALDVYKTAMQQKPDDDGAVFNAGVMQEALGHFAEADQLYFKAFQMGKKQKYIDARQRVHRENPENRASK